MTGSMMGFASLLTLMAGAAGDVHSLTIPEGDIEALKLAALGGESSAAKRLYEHYSVASVHYEEGNAWLRICAENGDVVCEYNYGFILTKSAGSEERVRGKYWLKEAAEHGSERAVEYLKELEAAPEKKRAKLDRP